jgi:hypothetical protein
MPVDSIGPATTRTTRGAIWPVSTELSRCITSGRMACPEYERLLQRYEAALRHWGASYLVVKSRRPRHTRGDEAKGLRREE